MFLILGLVLGSLVGLLTSLIRIRAIKVATTVSTIFAILIVLAGVIALVASGSRSSGDAAMANITFAALILVGIVGVSLLGLMIGAPLKALNGQSFWDNARSLVFDVVALSMALLVFHGFVASFVQRPAYERQEEYRKELGKHVEQLTAQLPPPYTGQSSSVIRGLSGQIDRREVQVSPEVATKVQEIIKAQDDYGNSYLHPYQEDNERQNTINRAAIGAWFVSIFLWPVFLKKRPTPPPVVTP